MKQRIKIIVFMMALAAVFGGAVTALQIAARETIQRNRNLQEQRQLIRLFDLGNPDELTPKECARLVEQQIVRDKTTLTDPETGNTVGLIEAYSDPEQTSLKAYGLQFRGLGFWAPIEGILAINPEGTRTLGLTILEQQETPGLGGRIEEKQYRGQFEVKLDITAPVDDAQSYLTMASAEFEPAPGDRKFAAITGATQTSIAMERILNNAVATFRRAENNPTIDQ